MRVKAEVVVAEVEVSPSSRTASMRAKAEVVVAEVEGEPLESSSVDEGEGRNSRRRSRRQTPRVDLYRRGRRPKSGSMLMHDGGSSEVNLQRSVLILNDLFFHQ